MAQLCKNLTAKTLNSSNVQTLKLSANTLEAQGNKLSQNTFKTPATVRLARPRSVAGFLPWHLVSGLGLIINLPNL